LTLSFSEDDLIPEERCANIDLFIIKRSDLEKLIGIGKMSRLACKVVVASDAHTNINITRP
jgi:hypothetical protein